MTTNPNRRGGSRVAVAPRGAALAPPAPFSRHTPPGTAAPSTQFASVPGRSITPGQAFGNVLGFPSVSATSGFPSQEIISQPYIFKPWDNGYHTRIGIGQIVFGKRGSNRGDELQTVVSLPQMNEILRKTYREMSTSGVIERATIDDDTMRDLSELIEHDLEDEVQRKRRLLKESEKENGKERVGLLTRLVNTSEEYWHSNEEYRNAIMSDTDLRFAGYQTVDGILERWSYLGIARNVETVENRFKNANIISRGPFDVDNIWGSEIQQSKHVGLILTRVQDKFGEQRQFVFRPWIEMMDDSFDTFYTKHPSNTELLYEDYHGSTQKGIYVDVGIIGRVTSNKKPLNRMAFAMSGVSDSPRSEFEAWTASSSKSKSKVFVTIGKDPWRKAEF